MVANITYAAAEELHDRIAEVKGVQSVAFDQTTDHYARSSALFTLTFDCDESDDACLTSLDAVKELLSDYDLYISTDLGDTLAETIDSEVSVIMVYVAIIVVAVLTLTSRTFGEVPVLLLTFVTAMILNQGTNFLLGKISFVSNSVTSVLQLALSLDYAVILCNRFKEEHQTLPIREAAIAALSKAIPEISASSLTTVGGLCAMLFMQFKIGADMGICLMKSILFALLAVFIVMPGLLVLFGPLIEKTEHRNLVPKISFVGRFAWASRRVIPFVFLVVVVLGFFVSSNCPYAYGYSTLTTPKLNETQIAENLIGDTFTTKNTLTLLAAWEKWRQQETKAARLSVSADCGPVVADQSLDFYAGQSGKKQIYCISKNGVSLYWSGERVVRQDGTGASEEERQLADTAQLLDILYLACQRSETSKTRQNGTETYTVQLDGETMNTLSAAIAPETSGLNVAFDSGSLTVCVAQGELRSISFRCTGGVRVVVLDTAATLAGSIEFVDRDFAVPENVARAL